MKKYLFVKKFLDYWLLGALFLILVGINACSLSAGIPFPEFEKEPPSLLKISLLIPLTGYYTAYGRQIRQGVELAIAEYHLTSATPQISLHLEDSSLDPASLEESVRNLAGDREIIAVIGPIFQESTITASRVAEEINLPLITLAPTTEEIPGMGNYVFRNALTPHVQVQNILQYAVQEKGYRSFAVFYPDTPYGRNLNEEFEEQVSELGGTIVFSRSYQEGKNDYQDEIIDIGGTDVRRQKSLKIPSYRTLPPPYDAIYLPGSFREVVVIIPQLRFQDINVPVLGSDRWHNDYLLSWKEKTLEGTVFTSGFFSYSPWPEVQHFIEQFRNRYGMEPDLFAALAYDTAKIILQGIREGNYYREEIRGYLSGLQNYPGVTGKTSFTSGDVEKRGFLLTVEKGKFVQIN